LINTRKVIKVNVGLNWENVSKRIITQIIYKVLILQREQLCHFSLYFVCPKPVYDRVLNRLGGKEKLPEVPKQPASIHFIAYDFSEKHVPRSGKFRRLEIVEKHSTAVYKVQEAFSSVDLPEMNVLRQEILNNLAK
jgi:hypothetical protein